jgi:hypothetical protein
MAPLAFDGRLTIVIAGAIGIGGAIALAFGIALEPQRALAAYLAAWTAVTTAAVGALAFLAIGYAANARWPAAVRRLAEAIAAALVPLALLFVPLAALGPWPSNSHHPSWHATIAARSTLYLAIFIVPAELLRRWSRRRDAHPATPAPLGTDALDRERAFGSAMLPPIGLALTFGAFDWVMSVQPEWTSSVFGLYVSMGSLASGLALVAVLAARGVTTRAIPLTRHHFHAMGRLLLAFVVLWAYIAFFQAFLIQIANRPDEVTFYVTRMRGGWRVVTALVVVLHFALPFPLLVPRRLKFRPGYVAAIAGLVLVAHYLDAWWLVVPPSAGALPSWTDLAAACAVIGLATCAAAWRARGVPMLATGDPYLPSGLDYASHL